MRRKLAELIKEIEILGLKKGNSGELGRKVRNKEAL